jgi:class III poly(R)-hydroxyalkanoic acid synthase PhaE subunit
LGSLVSAKPTESESDEITNPFDLWNKIAQESVKVWTDSTAAIAQSTAEQFFSVQETGLRFMELTANAWETLAPKMAAGEDWQEDLQNLVDQFREGWLTLPQSATEITKDLNQMWELFVKQWQSFGQPWDAALRQAPEHLTRVISGDSKGIIDLSNLLQQAYQGSLAGLVKSPGLGLTREYNEKIQQGFDSWMSWQLASLEYQGILNEIWKQAFEKFFLELVSMAERGETIDTIRDLILLWTRGAEDIFTENFRTERYVLAQGKMLNAAMVYRKRERSIMESYLSLYDLPTRSELDEAHRRIYELRKEVKRLNKSLEEIRSKLGGGVT